MKCSSILLGCLITSYEFFAYTESPPESPVALLSRVPRAASERIKLCWSMVKKRERSGWRESTSRRALFSLPLISGYPRSGFPQGKGGGAFALVPRRFADSWSKGIVQDFRQNWNYFLVCFCEPLSLEMFLYIQDRKEDFLTIRLYFQHKSLNFNNFHQNIRNVFLFFSCTKEAKK